jgi:hypothetical protein
MYSVWRRSMSSIELKPSDIWGSIQKFPDWPPPGVRTANGIALCHEVQLYHYFVRQSSEFVTITLCVVSQECSLLMLYISLSTQSGNFWIHPRIVVHSAGWKIPYFYCCYYYYYYYYYKWIYLHWLGPVACCKSEFISETMNPFRHFW